MEQLIKQSNNSLPKRKRSGDDMTQEMIDSVFSNKTYRKKFTHPRRDKAICEMRLGGAKYADIGKRFKASESSCMQCVRKVVRIYRVFLEGEVHTHES